MSSRYPVILLLYLILVPSHSAATDADGKPNILFIAVDDLRPELNTYGADQISSPNIDKLANEGIKFEHAYANIAVCGASRASLLTGARPTEDRFLYYNSRADEDYPSAVTLPEHFRNNGYYTISNGKIFHHSNDSKDSWDEIWDPRRRATWRDYYKPEHIAMDTTGERGGPPYEMADVPDTAYADGKIAQKVISDLKRLKEMGKPFFLTAGFLKPHLPFTPPKKYWDMYDRESIEFPPNDSTIAGIPGLAYHNSGELRAYGGGYIPKRGRLKDSVARNLIHGYYASVSYTDAQVGKLLQAVKDLNLENNTIVVLWGDHGWNLREHGLWCKHSNFETSLHVPLLFKVPGKQAGASVSTTAELVDIYPTLCDLAGLPKPDHLEGKSLLNLLDNPKSDEKREALSRWYKGGRDLHGVTYINRPYFYTEWLDSTRNRAAHMLFDHSTDPRETNNIANEPDMQNTVDSLSSKLRDIWYQ